MIFTIKKLNNLEREICFKTLSSRAIFSIVGNAIKNHKSISIVRMGDGEYEILNSDKTGEPKLFETFGNEWNKRMGINDSHVGALQNEIIKAGNNCTYFAPSVSGISFQKYNIYKFFKTRPYYFDNFYVNDWSHGMIKMLLESSQGVFIIHRDYKQIIKNFKKSYNLKNKVMFSGFSKDNWNDNKQAVEAAVNSGMQLILFSAGPAGKIIGPKIAKAKNKIVLDIGNTLMPWSKRVA